MDLVYVAWLSLGVLVLADALARRRHPPEETAPPPTQPSWLLPTLGGVAALLALGRLPLALSRGSRNVDEVMYAATAAFARDTGQSLFGWGWNLHGHQLLYLLGTWEQPYALVDVVTCLVVGLTAFLLGLTVLRAGGGRLACLLTPPFYALGIVRFEGLGANKELYAALFLAAYLLVRLGLHAQSGLPSKRPRLRRVLAGACLGAAFVMKDQAGLFVLAEPTIEALALLGSSEGRRAKIKAFLRSQTLAALGFALPVSALLLAFLSQGALGDYLSFMTGWIGGGGSPLPTFTADVPLRISLEPEPAWLTVLLGGLFALWLSAVGLLGLAHGLRLLLEAPRLPERPLAGGLAVVCLVGLVAVSIGSRWFGHYWLLLFPALAPLAALRAEGLIRELRDPSQRVVAGTLSLLIAVVLLFEVLFLASPTGRSAATGVGPERQERVNLERVAAWVREGTPQDALIFVYGWRPELYFAADRHPATRYVGGVTAGMPEILEDLRRRPPSLVLVPPAADGEGPLWNPYDLERNAALKAWLNAEGYARVAGPRDLLGYCAWSRRPR